MPAKLLLALIFALPVSAQYTQKLSDKVTLSYHPNIETYFIAEKLAVQHIGYYVFSKKDSMFAHEPLLAEVSKHFNRYVNTPCIERIAGILKVMRDTYYDNAQLVQYMLYLQPFPA